MLTMIMIPENEIKVVLICFRSGWSIIPNLLNKTDRLCFAYLAYLFFFVFMLTICQKISLIVTNCPTSNFGTIFANMFIESWQSGLMHLTENQAIQLFRIQGFESPTLIVMFSLYTSEVNLALFCCRLTNRNYNSPKSMHI